MDGHPRQNPAYRPAKETPANAGVSIWPCITGASRGSRWGSRLRDAVSAIHLFMRNPSPRPADGGGTDSRLLNEEVDSVSPIGQVGCVTARDLSIAGTACGGDLSRPRAAGARRATARLGASNDLTRLMKHRRLRESRGSTSPCSRLPSWFGGTRRSGADQQQAEDEFGD